MPARRQIYCPNCFRLKPEKQACIHPDCKFSEEVNRLDPLCLPYRTRLASQRYITGRLIGRGEYSAIYLCLDTDINSRQMVAIKEYLPWGNASRQGGKSVVPGDTYYSEFGRGLREFEQESEILKSLTHENILRHRDYFRENGTVYIVSDYCGSVSLEEHFKTRSSLLSEGEALHIFLPILNALDECHRKGIIHCDINPRNIQIMGQLQRGNPVEGSEEINSVNSVPPASDHNGSRPIIIDFGSAQFYPFAQKSMRPVTFTRGYSSPEQHEGAVSSFGPWTDIYGCAATLYRLTTGRIPLAAPDRGYYKDKLPPPKTLSPSLSPQFASAIESGLARSTNDRPRSISDFLSILPAEHLPTSYRSIRVPSSSPETRRLQKVFSKAREAIKFAPIYLLFLGLLWFIFSSAVSGGRPEPAETSGQALTKASDYYILRDVSGSTHFRPAAQELYDTVELLIRKAARPQDRLAPDLMSYGHFASFVTNGQGHGELQPATRNPDIVGIIKADLAAWKYPKKFFDTTDYEKLFISIRTAITEGDQRRHSFVFIITDGIPDLVGSENDCPPAGRWFTSSVENAFRDLVMNTKRAQFFILLLGGRPECSEHVKRQWEDMSQRMLKERDLQRRVTVRSLEGLEGTQIEDAILEDSARFGREPSITVESAKTRLTDDQRKALDSKGEFSGEFFIQAHFGDDWEVAIRSAVIRDRQGKDVADVDVLNRSGGDLHDLSDNFIVKIDNAPNRDGERKKYRLFFQPRWKISPDEMEGYSISPQVESKLRSKLFREKATKVEAEPSDNALARAEIVHRLIIAAVLSFLVAVAIIVLLALYASTESGAGKMRRFVRYIIIDPIKHWSAGFAGTAFLLLTLGVTALARTATLTVTLGFIVVLVALLSALNILQRPKDEMMRLSGAEIFLFSMDAIVIPIISIILAIPLR